MVPKVQESKSETANCFSLFNMVPKVDSISSNRASRFGTGLCGMVPKVRQLCFIIKYSFGDSLFDRIPKEQYVDLTEYNLIRFQRSKFFHSLLSYQKRPACR